MSVQPPPFPGTVPILYTTSGGRPPRPYLSLFPKKLNPNQAQDLSRDSPAIHRPSRLSREKAKRAACLLELLKPLPLALVLPPPSQPQPRASSSSLPDRPTPRRTRAQLAHTSPPCSPGLHTHKGTSAQAARAGDRGRQGGAGGRRPGGDAGKTVSEAGESWAGTGRLRRLGPQRPRSVSPPARSPAPQACPPRRRKRRRLRSAHAQFKLSPRLPPLPSPRPPRPGPAASLPRRSPL